MLGACASPLDKSDAMQMCFASGSAEKKAVSELPVSGTLPCHGTFGLFRIQLGSGGNGREQSGKSGANICRERFVEYFGLLAEQTVGSGWQAAKHEQRQAAPPPQPRPQPSRPEPRQQKPPKK